MDARWERLWTDTLKPWLDELELERKKALRYRLQATGMGFVAGLGFGALLLLWAGDWVFFGFGVFVATVMGVTIGNKRVSDLSKRVKVQLNTAIAEALELSYLEKPSQPARLQTLRDFDLLPSYNRCKFEDHFSGSRQGCDFELYEAHLEQRRRSNKRTYFVTVFRGVIIRINFPRKVEGVTVISRDSGWFNGMAAIGRSMGGHDLKRIGLVDPKFERIFEVYGDDQVLARYMLTPSFMERLITLEEALHGKRVRAMFDEHSGEGELLIAAETGNLFEIGSMGKPLADQSRVQSIVGELSQILEIIDLLVEPAKFGDASAVALD